MSYFYRGHGSIATQHVPVHELDPIGPGVPADVMPAELSKGWMVMVIDDAALRVVSSLVGMYDVMEHRVTLIELLKRERQPLPVRTHTDIQHMHTPTCNTG